jgi:SulP family sulfate permease
MNMELKAHGYSNGIAGLFGGLQNYMAYTQSIMYYKSGGSGKSSSLAVALLTTVLFIVGPSIASFMPRCMAGTLLLHCGMDLFIEGVYDSFGKYDIIEYTGILAIAFVMTLFGMEAALGAGAVSALLTYAIQSVAYPKPIRGEMTAATLRSSALNRSPSAFEILDNDETGRLRICVVQLQGHLFFG